MRAAALRWREPAAGAGLLFRIIGRWFMGERDTTAVTEEPAEEFFEPGLGELADEDFE